MEKVKILLIAHYFPPLNSTGSRRPESMVKNFKSFGFDVSVLTTKKNFDPPKALTLDRGIKVFQSSLFGTQMTPLLGYFEDKKVGAVNPYLIKIKQKILNPFLGQIGDPRLFFVFQLYLKIIFFKISKGFLFNWLKELESVDYVISTSPPWPCHLLAVIISKKFKKKLIIDYRDQFSANHMFSQNLKKVDILIDKYLCSKANLIIVISEPMREYYQTITNNRVEVIMNGFELESFSLKDKQNYQFSKNSHTPLVVRYFGTITNDRLMKPLWEVVKTGSPKERFHFEFYGDCGLLKSYLSNNGLDEFISISFHNSVSHKRALELMKSTDMLLFTETSEVNHASQRGVLTTKLFEYLASLKPIISIIDKSTLAGQIIQKSGLAFVLSNNSNEIRDELLDFDKFYTMQPHIEFITSFSRRSQFLKLKNLLNEI